MLVLTRKVGERVLIAEGIVVQIVAAKNGRVRLGVEAPREVTVRREELLTSVEREAMPRDRVRKPR